MIRKIHLLVTGLIPLMIMSCSDDNIMPLEKQGASMTFDVSFDTQISSRAESLGEDESPTRCVMGVYEKVTNEIVGEIHNGTGKADGKFEFTISNLEKEKEYKFVFWADTGEAAYTVSDLSRITSVSGVDGNIAFTGTHVGKPVTNAVEVKMKHAVAKLVVKETATLDVNNVVSAKFTARQYNFNALNQSYEHTSSLSEISKSYKVRSDNSKSGVLITCYMLAPNDNMPDGSDKAMMVENFKLGFKVNEDANEQTKTIPNVTFKANSQTVIEGSFKSMSIGGQSFATVFETAWGSDINPEVGSEGGGDEGGGNEGGGDNDDPTPNPPTPDDPEPSVGGTIALTAAGSLTSDMIVGAVENGNSLKITGPMNDDDFEVLRAYLAPSGAGGSKNISISLDLSGAECTTMPQGAFCLPENWDGSSGFPNKNKPLESLVSIKLPNRLTEIPAGAFIGCTSLRTVSIPEFVTKIGDYAFNFCGIEELDAPTVISYGNYILYECPYLTKIALGTLPKLGQLFDNCPNIGTVDLKTMTALPGQLCEFYANGGTPPTDVTVYVSSENIKKGLESNNYWKKDYITYIVVEPTE